MLAEIFMVRLEATAPVTGNVYAKQFSVRALYSGCSKRI